MKQSLKPILYVISIIMAAITACKKETEPQTVGLHPEGLKYVQMSLGKYFIFQDSASGSLDSVVVTKSEIEKKLIPESQSSFLGTPSTRPAYYLESFKLILTKFTDTSQEEWLDAKSVIFIYGYPFYGPNHFYLLSKDNFKVYDFTNNSSLNINGVTYNNVIIHEGVFMYEGVFMGDINDPNFVRRDIYYWAKGIGVIKRTLIRSNGVVQTQTLLRSNA